ncbi:MAG TPA: hypothetical protein VFZ70_09600 [Euzebyales bacterium]
MSDQRSTSSGGYANDVARREGEHLKGSARDAAATVGDTAAQHGQRLKRDAREHARGVARNAQRQLRGHAQEETQRAGAALSTAGDQLRALAQGRVDDAGVLGDYVDQAADAVNRWAHTVQDRGLDGLLDDLRSFGRRRPGMFLAGALAAGVVVGRFGRNAAQELGDETGARRSGEAAPAMPDRDDADGERLRAASEHKDRHVTGRDDAAWTPVGGLADTGAHDATDTPDPVTHPSVEPRPTDERAASDDVIIGYATDDSAVVTGVDDGPSDTDRRRAERTPGEHPRDEQAPAHQDPAHRPIDVEQGRSR